MPKNHTEEVLQEKIKENLKEELKSIEVLSKELEIKQTILAGIMTMKGWRKGKMLSKEELEEALLSFLNKSI
ncbi:hypothetical protein [[Clostridium] colinum]|uniref:hypothetical protein n=1 Tax=[Clostridium] colinum TaxID=36835 RepID=UPI0020251708|nr:hypothetical protein [[Clostridium] colinum]